MRQSEYELIDDTINANGPAHEIERRIVWVAEDEMVRVERGETLLADATGHGGDVVYVGLGDHGRHCALYIALAELVETVLVPDGLEVEIRTVEERLEEGEAARMRHAGGLSMVVFVAWEGPARISLCVDVAEGLHGPRGGRAAAFCFWLRNDGD